jgi:hypothetical protein
LYTNPNLFFEQLFLEQNCARQKKNAFFNFLEKEKLLPDGNLQCEGLPTINLKINFKTFFSQAQKKKINEELLLIQLQ